MRPSTVGTEPGSSALDAARRTRELDDLAGGVGGDWIDVLVIGGGITGVGVALDAASRGLRTVLVEREDLAHGTSRWSSKMVHGGLRYLASGHVAIAHESAQERHLLLTRIAPHLTRPLAQVVPLYAPGHLLRRAKVGLAYGLGDALRRWVGTPADVLHASGRIGRKESRRLLPAVRADGLRGGLRGWEGQLIDDARLVVSVARTAAGYGATILTRVAVVHASGDKAVLKDTLTGQELTVRARAVINATGVWAGELDPSVHLRPSRGTHLVLDSARLGASDVSLLVPVPGSWSRMVFTVPAVHGRTYVGLTDVPAGLEVPDVPQATEAEIDMLLATMNTVLAEPLTRDDVIATYAGLRPLLAHPSAAAGDDTADLSRRHAIVESPTGLISVVGGKLTTYRRMANDAVDEAVRRRFAPGDVVPSRTRTIPLVGACPRDQLPRIKAPARLVRRYGTEAPSIAGLPNGRAGARAVTAQELHWAVAAEGALSVADVLDRRTRLGLVEADREDSLQAAVDAFARAGIDPV